jgi:hypothetical protein
MFKHCYKYYTVVTHVGTIHSLYEYNGLGKLVDRAWASKKLPWLLVYVHNDLLIALFFSESMNCSASEACIAWLQLAALFAYFCCIA